MIDGDRRGFAGWTLTVLLSAGGLAPRVSLTASHPNSAASAGPTTASNRKVHLQKDGLYPVLSMEGHSSRVDDRRAE